jgi:hypothetical protein
MTAGEMIVDVSPPDFFGLILDKSAVVSAYSTIQADTSVITRIASAERPH